MRSEEGHILAPSPEIVAANKELEVRQRSDERLQHVGRISVLATHEAAGREHTLLGVPIDEFRHRIWLSEPVVATDDPVTIVAKPGWCEPIETGIGLEFHTCLADEMPGARVISHATEGVGQSADSIPLGDLLGHGTSQMAEHGLRLLEAFCRDQRLIYIGISMGTVIGNDLLRLNLQEGKPVDFAGVVHYAPALVDPHNVARDMGLKFFPDLVLDAGSHLLTRTKPDQLVHTVRNLLASRPRLKDVPPILRQGVDLLHGTPEAEIDEVLANYTVAVITGTSDPVGQYPMWLRKAAEYDMVLEAIKDRGHDIAIHPRQGARKIAKVLRSMQLYSDDQA